MNKIKNNFNLNNKNKNTLLMNWIVIILLIIFLIIFIYHIRKNQIDVSLTHLSASEQSTEAKKDDNFENKVDYPNYLFIYGKNKNKNNDELMKLFKDEYKESTMNIKVLEKDINKQSAKENDLKNNKINPTIEYEVRYYPNGYNDKNLLNYDLYLGKISDLKDIILKKENEFEDKKSENENSGADNEFKSLSQNVEGFIQQILNF